jgi:hypothetical protein
MPKLPSGTVTLFFTDIDEAREAWIREASGLEFERGRAQGRGRTLDDAVSLALA